MTEAARRLLVVDDDAGIRSVVRAYAAREGFAVEEASDGGSAADRVAARPGVDVVVLDLMIPGLDGWELCRRWRAEPGGPAVIMLTARGAEAERVLGLGIGADDYVVKPFSPLELMARVRAVLRRVDRAPTGAASEDQLRLGDVEVDLGRRRATSGGREVTLTRGQLDLLAALLRAGDRISTRIELLTALGGGEVVATDRAVDQQIVGLRRALADVGSRWQIASVRGVGYRLEERGAAPER